MANPQTKKNESGRAANQLTLVSVFVYYDKYDTEIQLRS